ncbi:MAG: hypothetical protein ACOX3G_02590 [Armatimonadota bacterium]
MKRSNSDQTCSSLAHESKQHGRQAQLDDACVPVLRQRLTAAFVGLLFGVVAGWGVDFFGLFMLFLAAGYGAVLGEIIARASGRRPGIAIEIAAVSATLIGALAGRMAIASLLIRSGEIKPPLGLLDVVVDLVRPSPVPLIALFVIVTFAVGWMRHTSTPVIDKT